VLVGTAQIDLVDVRVVVTVAAVAVQVCVLDVLVSVLGVRMGVNRVPVVVLVLMRALVGVIVSHENLSSSLLVSTRQRLLAGRPGGFRRRGREVLNVPKRLVQERGHVHVMQRVDRGAARLSAHHKAEITQDPQLVRDGRLGHLHCRGQFADRARRLSQMGEYPHPAGRGQRRHQPRDLLGVPGVDRGIRGHAMSRTHAKMLTCTFVHVKLRASYEADSGFGPGVIPMNSVSVMNGYIVETTMPAAWRRKGSCAATSMRLAGAVDGDEGHEQVVHDREDSLRRDRLVGHQHVVAHQVERHGQDDLGDAVEVDLAALVRPGEDLG